MTGDLSRKFDLLRLIEVRRRVREEQENRRRREEEVPFPLSCVFCLCQSIAALAEFFPCDSAIRATMGSLVIEAIKDSVKAGLSFFPGFIPGLG